MRWNDPEDVQLIAKQENDFQFRMMHIFKEDDSSLI